MENYLSQPLASRFCFTNWKNFKFSPIYLSLNKKINLLFCEHIRIWKNIILLFLNDSWEHNEGYNSNRGFVLIQWPSRALKLDSTRLIFYHEWLEWWAVRAEGANNLRQSMHLNIKRKKNRNFAKSHLNRTIIMGRRAWIKK